MTEAPSAEDVAKILGHPVSDEAFESIKELILPAGVHPKKRPLPPPPVSEELDAFVSSFFTKPCQIVSIDHSDPEPAIYFSPSGIPPRFAPLFEAKNSRKVFSYEDNPPFSAFLNASVCERISRELNSDWVHWFATLKDKQGIFLDPTIATVVYFD